MATSLLVLLDDIASMMDDVAVLTKVAATKTSGVMGDDLALNAEQASGVRVERELPVVWAVAKGSLWNKVILVPVALLISALLRRGGEAGAQASPQRGGGRALAGDYQSGIE
jgi:predicted DNA repair protein MutK